jgi:uncharacterized protein (TIGR03067 family)
MKLTSRVLLAVAWCLAASGPGAEPAKNDNQLQGSWGLVSLQVNGQVVGVTNLKGAQLVIEETRYSFLLGDSRLVMTHVLNPAATPMTLDMAITEGPLSGKTFHAIYRLTNGTLTICRNVQPDQPRPSEFVSTPGSDLMVIVWRRNAP